MRIVRTFSVTKFTPLVLSTIKGLSIPALQWPCELSLLPEPVSICAQRVKNAAALSSQENMR